MHTRTLAAVYRAVFLSGKRGRMRAIAIVSLCVCLLSSVFAKPPLVLNYQDNDGQYNFGYADPLSMRTESRTGDGVTRGAYSYYDQNGAIQTTEYEAGKDIGFRVKATNLPEAPLPVDETIEVKNAREKHLQLLEEATRLEEEEKRRLSQVSEAKAVSDGSLPEGSAIPDTKIALNSQGSEVPATQIIPSFDVRAQVPEARSIPSAPTKENTKSEKISEPIPQTIPALSLQQQSQEKTANLRAQPLSVESPKQPQVVVPKQQEIFSKDLSNQGPLLQQNVLPEQRAFAAENPFLIPFLGQGFSFESALPQQRGLLSQQGQNKITAENINSELPVAPIQSRISEQSAILKQSIQNDQHALSVPGIQGPQGLQIQNDQLALPRSGIQGPPGLQIPGSFSNRAFAQSEISKESIQNDQRALPVPGIQGPQRLQIPNDQLALPRSGIQGTPGFQIPNFFSDRAFGQSEISKQSIHHDQRGLPVPGIQGSSGSQIPNSFSDRAFASQNAFPSGISTEQLTFPFQGLVNQPTDPKQATSVEQRTFSNQNGAIEQQRLPIQGAFPQQQLGFTIPNGISGQQGFPIQNIQLQQRTAPAQNAVLNQQGSPTLNTQAAQSDVLRQSAFPEQRTVLAQGGSSSSQIFPSANGFFGEGFFDHNTLLRQQGFLGQQGFSEHQPSQNIISKQQANQSAAPQQQISQQEVIARQNTVPEQHQGSISQPGVSAQQFIQPQIAILDQQSISRQNVGSEQQVIPHPNPASGQQLIQHQKTKCTSLEQKMIRNQNAPSEQQGINQRSGIPDQQVISNENVTPKQQAVVQQSAISGPQLIQPQSSIIEQQPIPSKLQQIPGIQQSLNFPQKFIQQQNTILEQGAFSSHLGGFGQQQILPTISEQQFFEFQRSIQNHNSAPQQQAVPQLQSIHGQQLIPQQGLTSEQQITSRNNVIGEEKKSTQNNSIPEQQTNLQQSILLDQQAIARQTEFPGQPLLLVQPSAISEQPKIEQNQGGIARQNIAGSQSEPPQAAVPEQRGVPQNLTPVQISLPKGFPEHLDQTHLQAESSDVASIRVPEPMSLSPGMPYESVKYTPEVMAAREAHFRAYAIAARLAEESDRNPQILMQLLKGSAGNIAEAESKGNQLENVEASRSAISLTAAPIIENLSTKSAEQILEKLPVVLPKVPEQRIKPLVSGSAPAVDARKIGSAEKVQPFTLPNGIEQPKVRTGLTPASTSLRVMDTRLPTLDEFQQSKLKEALALARDTSLKVTGDKQMTKKFNQPLLIVKPFGIDQIPSMQQPIRKNWATQYMRL